MNEELRDIKLPVEIPATFLPFLILLGLLLVAFLLWQGYRYLKKKQKSAPPAVVLPPWEITLKQLAALRAENLPAVGKVKEFYSRLSDIARRYIEERFSIRAPEMTTEEFLFSVKNAQVLKVAQKAALAEFLVCCDMVKFARFQSSEAEMEKSFGLVREFVEETKAPAAV